MVRHHKEHATRMGWLNLLLLPVLAALGLFETTPGGASGGEPATGEPAKPSVALPAEPPADTEPLGEGGKRALDEERRARRAEKARADAAEAELARVREAGQSDQEKAINDAKKQAAAEERTRWEGRAIRAEAKSALASAGAGDVSVAVAAFLDEHRDLKVNDDGEIEDLDKAVKAFKDAHKTLFTARVPSGSADQGAKPPDTKPRNLEDAISASLMGSGTH